MSLLSLMVGQVGGTPTDTCQRQEARYSWLCQAPSRLSVWPFPTTPPQELQVILRPFPHSVQVLAVWPKNSKEHMLRLIPPQRQLDGNSPQDLCPQCLINVIKATGGSGLSSPGLEEDAGSSYQEKELYLEELQERPGPCNRLLLRSLCSLPLARRGLRHSEVTKGNVGPLPCRR